MADGKVVIETDLDSSGIEKAKEIEDALMNGGDVMKLLEGSE